MLRMFSVYDSGTQVYMQPFFVTHAQVALRYFETMANDPEWDVCKFPASFTLFEVGEFDESSGTFNLHDKPINCGLAVNFKKGESK